MSLDGDRLGTADASITPRLLSRHHLRLTGAILAPHARSSAEPDMRFTGRLRLLRQNACRTEGADSVPVA
jgi:hypothetical protein